jgi:hypothetical protein
VVKEFTTTHAKESDMHQWKIRFLIAVSCLLLAACGMSRFLRGGIYKDLDESLTIVRLVEDPKKYLNKEIVFSVRYHQKGDLPCPLEGDYVNIVIADRVSYITLNKAWMKKDKADVLEKFKPNDTVVIKARVFDVDKEKDPDLEILEIKPEV